MEDAVWEELACGGSFSEYIFQYNHNLSIESFSANAEGLYEVLDWNSENLIGLSSNSASHLRHYADVVSLQQFDSSVFTEANVSQILEEGTYIEPAMDDDICAQRF